MMKRFFKTGKLMGLALVCAGLLFAGCMGPSSSEDSVTPGDQANFESIPISYQDGQIIIGNGSGAATAVIGGHTVALEMGDTPTSGVGAESTGWVRLVNLDSDEYMANAFVFTSACQTCVSARFDNADFIALDGTTCHLPGAGDTGCQQSINGGGYCYVEDGIYYSLGYEPFNEMGCAGSTVVTMKKPFQAIHPECGSRSTIWDFGNQAGNYEFRATVTADYFPWDDPTTDSRYDFYDRTTFYLMATDLADNLSSAPNRGIYAIGNPRRSNVMSGYGASVANVVSPGQYFAMAVGVEYPDRLEAQEVGNYYRQQSGYFYYNQIAYVLRYNPFVLNVVTSQGNSQGGTIVRGASTRAVMPCENATMCNKHYPSYTQFELPNALNTPGDTSAGWLAMYAATGEFETFNGFISAGSSAGRYYTLYGGEMRMLSAGYMPAWAGDYGIANFIVPKSGVVSVYWPEERWMTTSATYTYYNVNINQQGADADFDLIMCLYFFKVQAGKSGLGASFFLDTFSGYTSIKQSWTKSFTDAATFYAKGFAGDGWNDPCYPFGGAAYLNDANQGCNDPAVPEMDYILRGAQGELSNYNIQHSGMATPRNVGTAANQGGYQQWPSHVCVQ